MPGLRKVSGDPSRPRPEATAKRSEGLTREAFADLLEASSETLWTVAAAILGDPVGAEDVLQEAALAALQKRAEFQPGTSFLSWMGAYVRNHARNAARKRQRQATRPVGPSTLGALADDRDERSGRRVPRPDQELTAAHPVGQAGELFPGTEAFGDELLEALRGLGEEPRAALLLRVVSELSYREVGQALGIPEGTAASHVHRARAQLQDALTAARERTKRPRRAAGDGTAPESR